MPKYRVTQLSFIDSHLRHEGEEVEIDLPVELAGPNLEPIKTKRSKSSESPADSDTAGGDLV